jgi:sporulation protein YlmC with PRC-barrel domain
VRTLRIGEDVIDSHGRKLGSVDRLVVDPAAHRITHIVVDGHLVGVGRVADAGAERLSVDLTHEDLARLPEAHPGIVVAPGEYWRPPGGYVLENFLRVAEALVGQSPYVPPVQVDLDAETRHEISAGSPVWSGRRQLGKVTRVVANADGTISELVVRHGRLDGERRVPIERVTEVVGTNVHVDLSDEDFDALPRVD